MSSLVSTKGPSVTSSLPPARRTLAPSALGSKPPVSTATPARIASSPSLAIPSMSALGGGPALSEDLTMIMNRIVVSPFNLVFKQSSVVCCGTLLNSERNQGGQTPIAQVKSAPEKRANDDRKD